MTDTLYKKVKCNVTLCKNLLYETNGITERCEGTWCGAETIELEANMDHGTMECLSFVHKRD